MKPAASGPSLLTDTGRWLPLVRVAGGHVHDAPGARQVRLEEERLDVPARTCATRTRLVLAKKRARRRNVRAGCSGLAWYRVVWAHRQGVHAKDSVRKHTELRSAAPTRSASAALHHGRALLGWATSRSEISVSRSDLAGRGTGCLHAFQKWFHWPPGEHTRLPARCEFVAFSLISGRMKSLDVCEFYADMISA